MCCSCRLRFFILFFSVNTSKHTLTSLSSYAYMYVPSGCHCSISCCGNRSVALAATHRLFVRSLVWQPWLNNIKHVFSEQQGDNTNSPFYLPLSPPSFFNSFTCPLSTSFHLYSSSVTFSWSWQGAWGVWWAQLSLACSYCCYTEAYSKNNTLLRPQPLDLNITPLQKECYELIIDKKDW